MTKKTHLPSCDLAIDIAVQATKLFITLATSVLAFTVTFSDKISEPTWWLKTSSICLCISIIAGVFLLQKIIGELATNEKVSLYKCSIKKAAMLQIFFFIGGVLLVAIPLLAK